MANAADNRSERNGEYVLAYQSNGLTYWFRREIDLLAFRATADGGLFDHMAGR